MSPSVENLWRALSKPDSMGGYSFAGALEVRAAARECRDAGQLLAASHGYRRAGQLVWGEEHKEVLIDCLDLAAATAIECATIASTWQRQVLASHWATYALSMLTSGSSDPTADRARMLGAELARAEAMLRGAETSELADGLIVGGVLAATNLEEVHIVAPDDGVSEGGGTEQWVGGQGVVTISGAAEALFRLGDYDRAWKLLSPRRDACERFGRLGWFHAAHGCAVPAEAERAFRKASEAFEARSHDDAISRKRGWCSVEKDLYGPFFRSRSFLAGIASASADVSSLIIAAADALGSKPPPWCDAGIEVYRSTLMVLREMLVEGGINIQRREELDRALRFYSVLPDEARLYSEFVDQMAAGVEAKQRREGAAAVRHFTRAHEVLQKIPIIGTTSVDKVADAVISAGLQNFPALRSTLHDQLEGLKSEDQLRRVLLRLFREKTPIHAQILHGPVEYGKDLVVASRFDGRTTLAMYQAKLGDIKMSNWAPVRQQIEMMFQVPYSSAQLTDPPDHVVGVLVFNGHIHPFADPVVKGWIDEQKRVFGRTIEILNLDRLVEFVVVNRLYGAFASAMADLREKPSAGDSAQ